MGGQDNEYCDWLECGHSIWLYDHEVWVLWLALTQESHINREGEAILQIRKKCSF